MGALKKTTVYLSDEDMLLLRKRATTQNVTVAEAIRLSVQESCKPRTKEEKALWSSLDRIWAKTAHLNEGKIDLAVNKAVNEVRHAKETRRRS